jgi:hypothetical protein
MRPHSDGMLLNLPATIRLEWMLIAVANTLAYYVIATIMFVKGFIVQVSGVCTIKLFKAVLIAVSQ